MRRFGELESAVMDRLWARDEPSTVRDVLDELRAHRSIAYTTVMTVMDNLYKKRWLTRQLDGRAYRYRPVASRDQYSAALMHTAFDESGDRAAALVSFLDQMSAEDTEAVRNALRKLRRRTR